MNVWQVNSQAVLLSERLSSFNLEVSLLFMLHLAKSNYKRYRHDLRKKHNRDDLNKVVIKFAASLKAD